MVGKLVLFPLVVGNSVTFTVGSGCGKYTVTITTVATVMATTTVMIIPATQRQVPDPRINGVKQQQQQDQNLCEPVSFWYHPAVFCFLLSL